MRKLLLLMLLATCVAVAPASIVVAHGRAPFARTVFMVGRDTFQPNVFFHSTFRFWPGRIRTHPGATITWPNRTDAPHTITLVRRQDLPRTVPQLFNCAPCRAALAAHHFPAGPIQAVVPAGDRTLNAIGDSRFVAPHSRITTRIGARAGTRLYYLCAIHPWMQGEIDVQ
jgi:plastocyanin